MLVPVRTQLHRAGGKLKDLRELSGNFSPQADAERNEIFVRFVVIRIKNDADGCRIDIVRL